MGFLLGISRFLLSFQKRKGEGVPVCTDDLLFYSDDLVLTTDSNNKQYYSNEYNPLPANTLTSEFSGGKVLTSEFSGGEILTSEFGL